MKFTGARVSCAVLLLVAAFFSIFGVPASAEGAQIWIQVKIHTDMPNAPLSLASSDGTISRTVRTDSNGSARLLLAPEEYCLTVNGSSHSFLLLRNGVIEAGSEGCCTDGRSLFLILLP